jgi:hypothetical protein
MIAARNNSGRFERAVTRDEARELAGVGVNMHVTLDGEELFRVMQRQVLRAQRRQGGRGRM